MIKVKIEIPEYNQENEQSTYFKLVENTGTIKIKKILDESDNTNHNHIFVGKNEFIEFLNNATGVSGMIKIEPIMNEYAYDTIEKIDTIPISSGISAIIQS